MPDPVSVVASDPLVVTQGATFAYPGAADQPTLAAVDIELFAGELVILLGPNGGGKTTLLRGIAGELEPVAGSISVHGPIAYLPQRDTSRVDFPVTALDVVMMGTIRERRLWVRAGRDERSRALDALNRVGLEAAAHTQYGRLSGGQRRRVLLARTIVHNAAVVLLDEPTAGVDPVSAEQIEAALLALKGEGRLVVVASHDIEHAKRADRVICLNRRVVAVGPPSVALTDASLRDTYAAELTMLPAPAGAHGVGVVEHHHHDD